MTRDRRNRPNYQAMANTDIMASSGTLNVHDQLKHLSVLELRELCDADRMPFGVCVTNITGELNVGSVVRNALLTGARRVGILGRRKYDKRGTVGSENYVTVDRIEALKDDGITIDQKIFWKWIDENNFSPIFCEVGGTLIHQVPWENWIQEIAPREPCLVFGNENRGIQEDILRDPRGRIVSADQKGVIRSYNVATASGIIMHHMVTALSWW